jgi:hypothetical protein
MPKRNIHKTWLNRKDRLQLKRDRGTQYAFGARNVLRDAYRARQQFLDANDASEARIDWVTCVSLLRAVGHVLKKRDANRSAFLRMAVDEAWIRWKGSREANRIFFDFIDAERNALLKEFKSLMPVLGQEAPLPPASADT